MGTAVYIPERLRKAEEAIQEGNKVEETVRTLLGWFNAQRRDFWIVNNIRRALGELKLVTCPDFAYAYIDEPIRFERLSEEAAAEVHEEEDEESSGSSADVIVARPIPFSSTADPTYRIGKLSAANRRPTSVKPDTTIPEAVTLMLANDYSQLPVMTGDRSVKGMISWSSLGARLAMGRRLDKVADCMEACHEISSDTSIFAAIPQVVKHEAVLIHDRTELVTGIVTTSDLSIQFGQLGEPFLLLGEIENQIRTLIHERFTKQDLEGVRDPSDSDREVNDVSDLTFGEYLRLVENQNRWSKLDLSIDRAVFVKYLDHVREIRNDVMHFDPDGITEGDLEALRQFAQFLQRLQDIRKTVPEDGTEKRAGAASLRAGIASCATASEKQWGQGENLSGH